jgi:GR25 family glycosyltransferase involved in LPS biosynthesis
MSAYVPPHRRGRGRGQPATRGRLADSRPAATEPAPATEPPAPEPARRQWNNQQETQSAEDTEAQLLQDTFTHVCCINLKHRQDRWTSFLQKLQRSLGNRGSKFIQKVERFDAVNGAALLKLKLESSSSPGVEEDPDMPCVIEWDATNNSRYDRHISPPMIKQLSPGEVGCAMSHVRLWRKLAESENPEAIMLILEDDAQFYASPDKDNRSTRGGGRGRGHYNRETKKGGFDFFSVFSTLWKGVPDDWEILYLGFSDRGPRIPVVDTSTRASTAGPPEVTIFRPTYGFHTHAYAIKKSAALKLLEQLPVVGPLDVWLADNHWLELNTYCGLVANEGWRGTGANLISQDRKHVKESDIEQSGRLSF